MRLRPPPLTLLALLPALASAGEDLVRVGDDIVVAAGEKLDDVVCVGCSIRIEGEVRDAVAIGGGIDLRGTVSGDAVAIGGGIDLAPGARVAADAVAVLGALERAPGAEVGGEQAVVGGLGLALPGLLLLLLAGLTAGLVIHPLLVLLTYAVAGQLRVEVAAQTMRERTGPSLLTGAGLLVLVVVFYLLAPRLGPVAPFLAIAVSLLLLLALLFGYAAISYRLGCGLVRPDRPLLALVLGAALVTVLQLVPVAGLLLLVYFLPLALGLTAMSGLGTASDWLKRELTSAPATSPGPRADA